MINEQPIPASTNFDNYDPVACDHKLSNGFTAWDFLSGEQGAGPDFDVDVHWAYCRKCGEIKFAGRTAERGVVNRFAQTFTLHNPDAVAAIVKMCNWFCRDNDSYDPFIRLSDAKWLTSEKPAESSKREMLPYLGYGKVPDIEKPKHFWPEDTADLTKSVHLTLASILSEDVDYSEAIVAKAAKLIGLEWAGMMDAVYEGAAEWEQKYNSLKEKYDADLKEACLVHEKAINHMQAQLADKQKQLEQFKIDYKRRIEQINALDRKIAAVYEIIKDDLPLDHNQKPENE